MLNDDWQTNQFLIRCSYTNKQENIISINVHHLLPPTQHLAMYIISILTLGDQGCYTNASSSIHDTVSQVQLPVEEAGFVGEC